MSRSLITFDLDAKLLKEHYRDGYWHKGYADIQSVLLRHHFACIQGTVYLSERGYGEAQGTLALQEIAMRYAWFDKCVSKVWFYTVIDDCNAQFIIKDVALARTACEKQVDLLRQQMLNAGLSPSAVDEIIEQQRQFTIEEGTHIISQLRLDVSKSGSCKGLSVTA
ncbi:MAG: hypothetical protein LBE21_06915 [Pseudomonadales bacterium]|jgi:virulence-associated protein VapD|nr:hypothetical protein [Pseudomonadales bacterium]